MVLGPREGSAHLQRGDACRRTRWFRATEDRDQPLHWVTRRRCSDLRKATVYLHEKLNLLSAYFKEITSDYRGYALVGDLRPHHENGFLARLCVWAAPVATPYAKPLAELWKVPSLFGYSYMDLKRVNESVPLYSLRFPRRTLQCDPQKLVACMQAIEGIALVANGWHVRQGKSEAPPKSTSTRRYSSRQSRGVVAGTGIEFGRAAQRRRRIARR